MSQYSPIRGKCMWWRETPDEDDLYNPRISPADKRIRCVCFVEGKGWGFRTAELPKDCPDWRHCRYHMKAM
ncbi:MAG: hypothetical protein AB2L09_12075 [Coriobacteriia bacterium]